MLKPVAVYPDTTKKNGVLVMCEVMMPDGKTPHPATAARPFSTTRCLVWFRAGIFSLQGRRAAGLPKGGGFPPPQGKYYTGVGYENVGCIAREIVDTHLDLCLDAGINHEGINAEVAKASGNSRFSAKAPRLRRQM